MTPESGQVKFQHTCLGCRQHLQIFLDLQLAEIQKKTCPHCGHVHSYDNRDRKLSNIYFARLRELKSGVVTRHAQPSQTIKNPNAVLVATPASPVSVVKPTTDPLSKPQTYHPNYSPANERYTQQPVQRPGDHSPRQKTRFQFNFFTPRLIALSAMATLVLSGLLAFFLFNFSHILISDAEVKNLITHMQSHVPNVIYDRNGKKISELARNRTGNLAFEQIPGHFKELLLAAEDKNFYHHSGTDFIAFSRAFLINLVSMRYSQGASTITQQLVRAGTGDRKKSVFRKFREISLALALERMLDKEKILTLYINQIYLGHGAYGFDSAARFYFKKALPKLNSAEMLALVSLPPAPEKYSPLKNPAALEKKMNYLFNRFYPPEKRNAYEAEKKLFLYDTSRSASESVFGTRSDNSPFTTEYVRRKLHELLGERYTFDAGLKIETTIDQQLQVQAEKQTAKFIREIRPLYKPVHMKEGQLMTVDKSVTALKKAYADAAALMTAFGALPLTVQQEVLQSASAGIDPATGEILFMTGGAEFNAVNQLHRAYQMRRQTGSAIKPIIYSAAIESGTLHAMSEVEDSPLFRAGNSGKKKYWLPENITGVYEGKISLRHALAHSKNVPAIRTASQVGMNRIADQFRKFFFHTADSFKSRFRRDETIAIGSLEMSPLEMASAFAAFANNGVMHRPRLIRRITDSAGQIIYDSTRNDEFATGMPAQKRVLDAETTQIMVSLMRDSARRGGTGLSGIFGKTGTSNDYKDAWFVGGSRNLIAAVWTGFDNGELSMRSATGASVSGPLFAKITAGYHGGKLPFSPAAKQIKVCALTGKLPSGACSEVRTELFNSKLQPTEICQHGSRIVSHKEKDLVNDLLQKDFE